MAASSRAAPSRIAARDALRRLRQTMSRALLTQQRAATADGEMTGRRAARASTGAGRGSGSGGGPSPTADDAEASRQRWLTGLELVWKTEQIVLLPALQHAAPHLAAAVGQADADIELMRTLVDLASRLPARDREDAEAVLHGLADLHQGRVDALIDVPAAGAVRWADLEAEIRGLLTRWRHEIRTAGEIEDEERDPVGLPPR